MLGSPQLDLVVTIKYQIKRTLYNFTKQLNLVHPHQLCSQHAGGEIVKKDGQKAAFKDQSLVLQVYPTVLLK